VSLTTGRATAWNPNSNGTVNSIISDGRHLYIGGEFNVVGNQIRNHLAKIDTKTGLNAPSWNPSPNGIVKVLKFKKTAVLDKRIFLVYGDFTYIGRMPIAEQALVEADSGRAFPLTN
jgi:hypothetical protein